MFDLNETKVMKMSNNDKARKIKGFTLLEISISITIIGVLMVFALQAYTKYRVDQVRRVTMENVKAANTKIVEYLSQNVRYPCPAVMNAPRDTAAYGMEGDCSVPIAANGLCVGGTCVEEGTRTFARTAPTPPFTPSVRRGALPFRSLNLPEEMAYDGYGNRLQYAVTEHLATADYTPNEGAIEIVDANGVTVLKEAGSAQFIVFSTGENGVGGYSIDGVPSSPCAGAGNDVQNCNTSLVNINAIYRAMVPDRTAANYYDDVVAYDTTSEAPAWQYSDGFSINARQVEDDPVLVDDDDTALVKDGVRMDIAGEILVDGDVRAVRYCTDIVDGTDPVNEECFESDKLAGAYADGKGMECTGGTILAGIRNGEPICITQSAMGTCPAGTLMTGVDSNSNPVCSDPPVTCPEYTYSRCGENQTYPVSYHGDEVTHNFGFSYWRRLRCYDGRWQYRSSGGSCSCSAGTYTQTYSCGTGYTGTRTREVTTTCDDGVRRTTYGSWNRDNCTCVGASYTQTTNCPSGMSGQRTRDRTMACPSGAWSYGAWSSIEDSCTCQPRDPQERTVACGGGQQGTQVETKSYICPAGGGQGYWDSNWVVDPARSNCSCVAGTTQTKSASDCPSGEIGTVYYERVTNCDQPGGGWGPWVEVSNSCRLRSCVWRAIGSSVGGTFGIGAGGVTDPCTCGRANTACYLQRGTNDFINYSECACELDD